MLRIQNTNVSPHGRDRWRYPATDGTEIASNSYMNLKREVAQHYRANGQPEPEEQTIIDWLCQNVRVHCFDGTAEYHNKFTDGPFLVKGNPSKQWPLVLRPLKLLAKDGDRGLGDIAHRLIGDTNSDKFKRWYFDTFGRSCNCSQRQNGLNEDYPLP